MAEYIERAALKERLMGYAGMFNNELGFVVSLDAVLRGIDFQPSADVVEVKRGRWVLGHVEPGYCTPGGNRPWVCSECGQVESWHLDKPKTKFCGECGADMREGDAEDG